MIAIILSFVFVRNVQGIVEEVGIDLELLLIIVILIQHGFIRLFVNHDVRSVWKYAFESVKPAFDAGDEEPLFIFFL